MRVLVVGGGGREHALCWFLARTATVFCAPGNPGTAEVGTNLAIPVTDHRAILAAVRQHRIDLTVVGPEAPLAAGLVDDLSAHGLAVFGPTARAARIEASKAWAKEIMRKAEVPTARSSTFTDDDAAARYIDIHSEPLVVKASGLAAGKGAVVCATRAEARAAASEMLAGKFGDAGREVVVEEFLQGEELSILALTDGERVLILPPSQDHKRLLDGDQGPNTGGMGAYAPVSIATEALLDTVEHAVLCPTLAQLAREGATYRGVLYAGLMVGPEGSPAVVEFNCRFGDPETQVVLPVLDLDLGAHMWAIARGESWRPPQSQAPASGAAVTTVLAAPGYPDTPAKGMEIILPSSPPDDTILFHAGTTRSDGGALRAAGGRVLCATGLGPDVRAAQARSRALAEAIQFEGKIFRRDIGWREAARAGVA
ncbi:MAG: phosphoribosylamine--glycine ligase [Gemmatimonadetes bacterium]|nr:phosphoribosylamine--glycine ligase [Gemmatimonadota bacterium]